LSTDQGPPAMGKHTGAWRKKPPAQIGRDRKRAEQHQAQTGKGQHSADKTTELDTPQVEETNNNEDSEGSDVYSHCPSLFQPSPVTDPVTVTHQPDTARATQQKDLDQTTQPVSRSSGADARAGQLDSETRPDYTEDMCIDSKYVEQVVNNTDFEVTGEADSEVDSSCDIETLAENLGISLEHAKLHAGEITHRFRRRMLGK
ncbi:hypothetical protein BaRGS_00015126, partial [Batillaria attramentaria]